MGCLCLFLFDALVVVYIRAAEEGPHIRWKTAIIISLKCIMYVSTTE